MTTLEDFFTLAEMRDGLSDIVRVEELLQVFEDMNDYFAKSVGDAMRQWSIVASTLAATQNKECLNHFVKLDGLCFLNKWLQEALDSNTDVNHNNVKELIATLLASLERLPVHNDKLTASGIAINIQRLACHENVEIMKKASLLCDKWNQVAENVTNGHKLEQVDATQGNKSGFPIEEKAAENGFHEANPVAFSASEEGDIVHTNENENMMAECHHSESSHHSSSISEDIPDSYQTLPTFSLKSNDARPATGDANSSTISLLSDSVQESLSATKESSFFASAGFASKSSCATHGDRDEDDDNHCHVSEDVSDTVEEINTDPVAIKPPCHSSPRDTVDNSSSYVASVSETVQAAAVQPILPCILDSKLTESNSTEVTEPRPKGGCINSPLVGCSTVMESKPPTDANDMPQERCIIADTYSTANGPQFPCERNGSDRIDCLNDRNSEMDCDLKKKNDSISNDNSSLNLTGSDSTEEIDHTSELGFMCVDDALEVARQVAIEVEREVVDYREAFCSSPEVNFGEDGGANSSDSEERKQDREITEDSGEHSSSPVKDISLGGSSIKEGSKVAQIVSSDMENLNQGLLSQKLDAPVPESVVKSEVDRFSFDLNADILIEEHGFLDMESNIPVNVSAPVAVIAPSRGAPLLPVTLQFEGGMGWKGTAATSAFRPASPRKISESEKTVSISKQKRTFIDIDLNVAESEDEVVVGQISVKQRPFSLPSGDSSTEVSSQKVDKLKLDLNRLGDEDASTSPTPHFKFQQNGEQSLSSASSSSSKHHSIRDFDLNDNPSFLDVGASHNFDKCTKSSDAFGASSLSDPVISIMSSRMVVERKNFNNEVQQLFPTNGFNIEHSAVAGSSMPPYMQMPPPVYSFAGLPTGSALPATQAFYSPGSFPYIDARGQTGMPQVTGASGYLGPVSSRPPFFMNIPAATSKPVVYGSPRPDFDMNAGMTLFDTSAKGVNFKQFLFQGQTSSLEDQTKAVLQPSSSVLSLKRKEPPDSGWESYPYGYKQ